MKIVKKTKVTKKPVMTKAMKALTNPKPLMVKSKTIC